MQELHFDTLERLPEAAARFVRLTGLLDASADRPRVFAFNAPMGAGKTTFISEVCRQLGSDDEASSPTFSIVNEYDTQKAGKVYHLDCYRLEGEEEGMDIGVEDYFLSGCPCFVEWPENIGSLIPEDAVYVEISVDDMGARTLRWK